MPTAISRRHFSFTLAAAGASCALRSALPAMARAAVPATPVNDLTSLTIAQASAMIHQGKVTPSELADASLKRIEIYNPKLNAFITVLRAQAMEQARILDEEQKNGKLRGPLHGIPLAVKDNMKTAGVRTSFGSAVLDSYVPKTDAVVVERLRAAGAILLGKANMSEFAFGPSYFGPARNPWDVDRDTGGSSSGSAVAVASSLCFGALGTDTACSVRMPASWCGVVGLKPTYGLVPLEGILPDSPFFAHCGPLTRTAEDTAFLLNAIAGYVNRDITSANHPKEDYIAQLNQPVSGFKIGIARAPFFDHLDPDVAASMEEAIRVISGLSSGVEEVHLPTYKDLNVDADGMMGAEGWVFIEHLFDRYSEEFTLGTRNVLAQQRKELNAPVEGCGAQIADYIRGRDSIELIRRTVDEGFAGFDLAILPTERRIPRTLEELRKYNEEPAETNPENEDLRDCTENNTPFDVNGLPALTVPCGFTRGGLPVGLQIVGPNFSEGKILALAHAYQKATKWTERKPPISPEMKVPIAPDQSYPR
jgi:aspartyl-tRNA(Asn)/glutamyl-tRNA(Gln) amidotransferase subunit A